MNHAHLPSLDSVDAGAPANEIEITPEMIEAGVVGLRESSFLFENLLSPALEEIVVSRVLRAVFSRGLGANQS